MKIDFTFNNFAFTSNSIPKLPQEGIIMGYDDSISSKRRESIREHLESETGLAYLDYYELPKSDYAMEQMLKSWGLKTDKITKEITIPPYLNFIALGNNNFRGALPTSYNEFKDLKKSGITTVISAAPRSGIKNAVENNGMNYLELVVKNPQILYLGSDSIFNDFAFYDEEGYMERKAREYESYGKYDEAYSSKEFIDKMLEKERNIFITRHRAFIEDLIKAVRAWQKGCCFIGCEFGTNMTSEAISVIDTFNPKDNGISCSHLRDAEKGKIKNLYKKLTPQDKKLMGWTKKFESSFLKRFAHI